MSRTMLLLPVVFIALVGRAQAQSNIDPTNKFAWGENIGWTNWRDADSTNEGVVVGDTFLTGYIWAENAGWINTGNVPTDGVAYENVDDTDFGVNIASDGALSGFAWSENVGWVNFEGGAMATPPDPARIECDGRLNGFVWSENAGWTSLSDSKHFVSVDEDSTPVDCDMNRDGVVDAEDIQIFVNLLIEGGATWQDLCSGDLDSDGTIDTDDVALFVDCLLTA